MHGKPIQGSGEVQVYRRLKKSSGTQIVVGVLCGNFSNGMLTAEGAKGNFTFNEAGKPVDDTYTFKGNFENNVLNGKGVRTWTGAKTDRPSAVSLSGTWKDGVFGGGVVQGRLNPLPGVVGDYFLSYVEQSQLHGGKMLAGHMFFYNDPSRWKVEFIRWKNALPVSAAFTCTQDESGLGGGRC